MKAVVVREFGPIGKAKVEELPEPTPAAHEVLVSVEAVPANYVDTLVLEGKYQFLPKLPFIPGKGPAGIVAAVGGKVKRFKTGDRVLAMAEQGGYAKAVCAHEDQCYALPDAMSFEAAATLSLAFDTSWFALLERGRLKAGETVLVLGATGAVGGAAIQLAKAKGAQVIAAVSSPAKASLALKMGADHTIDLSAADLRNSLREQVFALTDDRGADIIIDPLGGDIFDAAIRCLAWRGRLVVVGFAAGRIPALKVNYVLLKNIEVSGLQVSDYRKRCPDLMRECFADIFALFEKGAIVPGEYTIYTLEAYAAALDDLLARKVSGRAILKP